jgi:hypothetical protein
MTPTETLLAVNSMLLTLLGILVGIVGFFLRDFHMQFKQLVQTVTSLCVEVAKESAQAEADRANVRRELDGIHQTRSNP